MNKLIWWLMIPLAVAIGMGISKLLGACRLLLIIFITVGLAGCAHSHAQLLQNCRVPNPYVTLQGRHDPGQELPQQEKIIVGTYEKITD